MCENYSVLWEMFYHWNILLKSQVHMGWTLLCAKHSKKSKWLTVWVAHVLLAAPSAAAVSVVLLEAAAVLAVLAVVAVVDMNNQLL